MDDKKLIFSAIQPTGTFTLGNYIGAIRNWAPLQEQFNSIYCVADMHAITVKREEVLPAEMCSGAVCRVRLRCSADQKASQRFLRR